MQKETLEENRRALFEQIDRACQTAGREPSEVRLVAVTKTVEPEVAAQIANLGTLDLGENRVPELERKHAWFAAHGLTARWHFIGHIQRNKARRIVGIADVLHSVDSLRLLESLARLFDELDRHPDVYLQVDLSGEAAKTGFPIEDVPSALARAKELGIPIQGLMAMAPLKGREDPETSARPVFRRLKALAQQLPDRDFASGAPLLSMGMSGDFDIAIEEGAHLIRVGSALYVEKLSHDN